MLVCTLAITVRMSRMSSAGFQRLDLIFLTMAFSRLRCRLVRTKSESIFRMRA